MNLNGVQQVKGIRRFSTISRIMIRHGFGDLLDRIFSRKKEDKVPLEETVSFKTGYPSPVRVRRVLEDLGPSFIKLGQLMSVRADLFPPEYTEQFKKLQDQAPPVPFEKIRHLLEADLGAPLEELYASFSTDCIAAASVAQVHEACLKSGERAAVKVIRPGIVKMIRDDLRVMHFFAGQLENLFEIGKIIGLVNLVKEFERTIFRELDMFIEAGNIEQFAANFADIDEIHIAEVYWDYTAKSVLTMEYIDGIKMDQVEKIIEAGIDPKEIAMIGLRSFSRQLMDFGFFHADPHPGNTLVRYDGRVSLVDFGIVCYLDEETMMQIANIFLGYAEHDYDMVMDAFRDAGLIDNTIDLKEFRTDLKEMSEPFYGRSLQSVAVKDVYEQVMSLAYKYRIRLPRNLLLLLKTFVQTEGLGKILGSDASLLEVTKPYAKKLVQRGMDGRKLLRHFGRDLRTLVFQLKDMPGFIHDIFKRTAEGRHRMEVRVASLETVVRKIEKSVNRIIMGVIISASTIAGSLVLNSPVKVMEFTIAGHTLSVTTLLGVTGYTIATLLGLWLIISIFRSGKM